MSLNIDELKKEHKIISEELSKSEVLSDIKKLQELTQRYKELEEIISLNAKLKNLKDRADENENIIKMETDAELKKLAEEELETQKKQVITLKKNLEEILSPDSGADINEVILEIRAGVGGEEAALFAQNLFRMYTRFAEIKGWKVLILDESKSELRGIKEVTFEINGKGVYKALRYEIGVHRVQRIPETEKGGRIHTSAASVAVLPKAKPVDIEIKPENIKMEAFRSSGPGGQNVNKVSTAVRIIYIPTGLVVASQSFRTQPQNKEAALTILRSKLFQEKIEKEAAERSKERKEQIGSGGRSEKIRTYNFPQDRVTDHRINKSWHGISRILDGQLDKIVEEFQKHT